MTKTYYIINYKVNGKSVYWGTAKELSYVDGTTDFDYPNSNIKKFLDIWLQDNLQNYIDYISVYLHHR